MQLRTLYRTLPAFVYGTLVLVNLAMVAARLLPDGSRFAGVYKDVSDLGRYPDVVRGLNGTLTVYGSLTVLGVVLMAVAAFACGLRAALPDPTASRVQRRFWGVAAVVFALAGANDQLSLHETIGNAFDRATGLSLPWLNNSDGFVLSAAGLAVLALAWRHRAVLRPDAEHLRLAWVGIGLFGLMSVLDPLERVVGPLSALEEPLKLFATASLALFVVCSLLAAIERLAAAAQPAAAAASPAAAPARPGARVPLRPARALAVPATLRD